MFKPSPQMVVRASTGGLGADFNEILARHASASYKFGKTYDSRTVAIGHAQQSPQFPCEI